MLNKVNNNFFIDVSKHIDELDYSSYTLQYPPPFILNNEFNNEKYTDSFKYLKEDIWLYIHIPFCDTKCTFCRYFSIIDNDIKLKDKYVEYLIKEMNLYKNTLWVNKININSLYIWWWTPSFLSVEQLDKLLSNIFSIFKFSYDFQFCFEANPNSLNIEKIKLLKKYTCHRLTLWVQSMDLSVLKKINRKQTKKDVFKNIYFAKKIGIPYINIDLMLGVKWQTFKSFIKDLEEIIYLKPSMIHLHPYVPTNRVIDNNIFFSNNILKDKMMLVWNKILEKYWYFDIEWDAKGNKKWSWNKQLYDAMKLWKYIWIWTSSVGFNNLYRYINYDNLEVYFKKIDNWIFPIKFASVLTKRDNMIQYIIYNMRYKFIDLHDFSEKFNLDILIEFKNIIKILLKINILEVTTNRIYFKYSTPEEYSIYSKYFYDNSILNALLKKIWNSKNMI